MTKIRVRYPDRVRYDRKDLGPAADQPGDGRLARHATQATAGVGFVPLEQLATIEVVRSPNELWRENQQPVITVTAELEDRDLGSANREIREQARRPQVSPGLSLGAGGQLSRPARIVRQLRDGAGGCGRPRVPAAGLPIPQPHAADSDLPRAAGLAGQRPLRPLDHAHAAERVVVHGGDSADRAGREERHHPDRIHRPASRGGDAAARSPA